MDATKPTTADLPAVEREITSPSQAPALPFVTHARLADGASVVLRDALAADAEPLRRMFLTLSDRSRYYYFCAGIPANEIWADRFASLSQADGCGAYALVAEVAGDIVGLARFTIDATGETAEIGIMLADAWQSRGLGGFVMRRLAAEARRRAVGTLTGQTLWENRRMLRLARRIFPGMRVTAEAGVCFLTMDLWI